MTSAVAGPLLFAAHLFSLLVALGAVLALARDRERGPVTRWIGALGFLALAWGEAYHGAAFGGEEAGLLAAARSGGYALLLVSALLPSRRVSTAPAAAALAGPASPAALALPAALGAAAGLALGWRRRRESGGLWMGLGLVVLGAADAALALSASWADAASHILRVAGYLAIARFVAAATRQSVRFRYMVAFASLLMAVILVVASAVSTVIDRNLRQTTLDRLIRQADVAQSGMAKLGGERAGSVALIGDTDPIQRALREGQTIRREGLDDVRRALFPQVGFILFTSAERRLLGLTGLPESAAVELTGSPVVAAAAKTGGPKTSLDALPVSRQIALIAVAPVKDEGRLIGLAIAGNVFDRPFLRQEVIAGTGVQTAAFLGFRSRSPVLVSAEGFERGTGEEDLVISNRVLSVMFQRFLRGSGAAGRLLEISGVPHFAALSPLRRADNVPIGVLVVAEPATVLAATQRQVNQVLFLLTLGVVTVAFLLAMLLARRITRPIVALTGAARRVQGGDLEARAEPRGEDEVADLAQAFNRMTESVAGMTSELREAAEEQARLRARLETVVNSMGDGLIAVNDTGRVVTYNPAAGSIVGLPRSRVLGKPLREVLHARDAGGRSLRARKAVPTGMVFVRQPDGDEIPVAISSSPLMDGSGEPLGRVYVLRDMSREHEVERMKTEFLSNVSHELRTPLTPIIGYSEILHRRQLPSRRAKEFAGGILDSARRLERIVAMLVDFSAIEGGRMAVTVEPVSLRPLIKRTVEDWRGKTSKHRVVGRVRPGLPDAMADIPLISRILDELVDNAIKYSPDGGTVTVAAGIEDGGPKNGKRKRMLRVDVTDQGIGIEAEDIARIFQDFRQVDASDTRAFGGLGLGLAFVKRVVEAHGGMITAASRPGKGSTFSFTLPAADSTRRGRKR
jgi:two-component system phosphate regulon sensor histidine kinase PhoR